MYISPPLFSEESMPNITVEVHCAGCGKFVEERPVALPYYGPPKVYGCCDACFKPEKPAELKES